MTNELKIEPIDLNELEAVRGGAGYNGCVITNGQCSSGGGCFITNGKCTESGCGTKEGKCSTGGGDGDGDDDDKDDGD